MKSLFYQRKIYTWNNFAQVLNNIKDIKNSKKKTSQKEPNQVTEKIKKYSPEVNQLSQEFDIPSEKLEKLLSYFQNIEK